ncbi:aldose epimerase family protein [Maridesulfovibrio ferrireducens]|uniref:aldose epimerase family protein n=1 Tax=Maridesulfovibrio ferrireducens TaxID=246191 RepID=UPI001A1C371A|nr:aldose epimerase family protein [Maridesulfovibrio ferrireducens]MBI9110661.1 galactose mutarotase [Maridesulfovibrio ferrireducens]
MSIERRSWGRTPSGEEVSLYILNNKEGYSAGIATYGATLTKLDVPISRMSMLDVVLGFDELDGYLKDDNYFGATIGRTAGRISQAEFELDGKKIFLDKNEGENQLHGGAKGFHNRVWTASPEEDAEGPSLKLCYDSPDGESCYPGNLRVSVIYTLIKNGLRIDYRGVTDSPTPVNMTAHPYFNLNINGEDIGSHELKIFSSKTLNLDDSLIPNGEIIDVAGTEADFTDFSLIKGATARTSPLKHDRFYVLNSKKGEMNIAAIVRSRSFDLELEVATTQSGLQFYSGDSLSVGYAGKYGCQYGPRSGFCLEPHAHPDAPNQPKFPSVILRPGEIYEHSTEYRFREFKARS